MNITVKSVASKLFVAFVAASMLVMLATPAKAATAEELQAQIDALMAQIAALQGSTPAATTPAAGCTFTRALTVGSQGADVKCLQDYLTPTYFTNAGGSTGYFGSITAAAVAAWQTANGVSPAAGYFGPISQAKYTALMAAAPTTPSTDDSDDEDTDTTTGDLSGEASLDEMTLDTASDDTLEEGAEGEVALAKFTFTDGDAMITRMDVTFDEDGAGGDVWDVLDEVSLVVDGKTVATLDASDEDNFKDTTGSAGTLRFTGLSLVGMEDEDLEVSVVAKLQGNIDGADEGAYSVSVDSIRYVDAEDVTTTEDNVGDMVGPQTVNFDVQAAGADDQIIVKTSTEDPDGSTITVKDDARSDWSTVFAFDLDTKDSTNDIDLKEVPVKITVSSTTFNNIVDDYELVIDGTTIDKLADNNGGTPGDYTDGASVVLTFDVDKDVTIDSGDRVTAELRLRFKSLPANLEGTTVDGKVTSAERDDIVAEGADDVTDLSGTATGDVHTLRTKGVDVEAGDMSATVTTVDGGSDYATYEVQVDVTAFDQDAYFSTVAATSTDWSLVDSSGNSVTAGTRTVVLDSTGDEESGYFIVREGETETFTLTVTYKPGSATSARLQLDGLTFDETGTLTTTDDQSWTASPATDYRTAVKTITD